MSSLSSKSLPILPDLTNHIAGGYRIGKMIGRGGQASVWLASKDRELYAIKVFTKLEDGARQEIVAINHFNHPRIVKCLEVLSDGELILIVMEYCAGGSLEDEVKDGIGMSTIRWMFLAKCLIEALAVCHSKGYSHRDIKASNILYRDVGRREPVLADFGLACNHALGECNVLSGTPIYFAPEMIVGDDEWDPLCADVWSLGLCLAWAANGSSPYRHASTRRELAAKIAVGDVTLRDDLDARVLELLRMMLCADPTKRATAQDLLSHIEASWPQDADLVQADNPRIGGAHDLPLHPLHHSDRGSRLASFCQENRRS